MTRASDAPGLKWRQREGGRIPYWLPPAKDIANGYRPKSIPLDPQAEPAALAQRCRDLWADLERWRSGITAPKAEAFTVGWLVDHYLTDELSPFHALGQRSQRSYTGHCNALKHDIGLVPLCDPRLVISGQHIRRWHAAWSISRRTAKDNDGKEIVIEEPAPSKGRHMLVQLRILMSYAVEIGMPGAAELRNLLKVMRFKTVGAREVAPTREQVTAIASKALEMGWRSIAMTTLAQFELIERRTHIIGEHTSVRDADGKMQKQWRPGWIWTGMSADWTIRYHQTKVGRVERVFDLTRTPALLALLQMTPEASRVGPVMVCETTKKPWKDRHYATKFRSVARAAGVPDEVWSMDMRAGGATEADSIEGISDRALLDAGGWSDPRTSNRYRRSKQRNANNVVELRAKARGE